jgi:hypothetical protein
VHAEVDEHRRNGGSDGASVSAAYEGGSSARRRPAVPMSMPCEARAARLVRVRVWVDKARYAGGDNPSAQCHRDFMLEERDECEDGVGEGRVVEADERVGLFVGGFGKVARAPGVSGGEGQGMTR